MTGTDYYNEIDSYAADWLENLIAERIIPAGVVDRRSIEDVHPADLRGFRHCHFFAGIGGWAYALQLAGWPDDRPVWTGSCPCQPFSAAGKRRGSEDARHLWPAFFRLIRECRPAKVFGEQVAGAAGLAWWDHVAADLETEGYAAAAADLPACGVGAPHARQRLYWVASDDPSVDGPPHDHMVQGGARGSQIPARRLPGVEVLGGRWTADSWLTARPTLVRNHHGLSKVLAGFGNSIVPQLAAAFIEACGVMG